MKNHEKLIIVNQTGLGMPDVLRMVIATISQGRLSNDNKQYCYLTNFNYADKKYHVVSDLNKNSDKLTIYEAK